jgi:hypothetical protein
MDYYLGKINILDHFSCEESLIWTLSSNDTLLSVIFLIVWPWILTITHVPHRCTPFIENLHLTCTPFGNFCTPFGTWWDGSPDWELSQYMGISQVLIGYCSLSKKWVNEMFGNMKESGTGNRNSTPRYFQVPVTYW